MNKNWWQGDYEGSSYTTNNKKTELSVEAMNNVIEELLKNKLEIKSSEFIEKGKYYLIDHEELRKTMPFCSQRGKSIYCNPLDEPFLRATLSVQFPNVDVGGD